MTKAVFIRILKYELKIKNERVTDSKEIERRVRNASPTDRMEITFNTNQVYFGYNVRLCCDQILFEERDGTSHSVKNSYIQHIC